MNCIIPYTKEVPFDSKIKEITSISLEHEMNINNGEILGNFIVSGEYKAHELSVNKEKFEHVLPFSIDLNESVDESTVKFNITDFSYEILNDNVLKVMIEFTVDADEVEVEKENVFVTPKMDDLNEIEMITDRVANIDEEKEELETQTEDKKEEKIDLMVNNTISNAVDTYKTYHVHIVKENENIEMICEKYKSNKNLIEEYNNLSEITPGDKLIIPEDD